MKGSTFFWQKKTPKQGQATPQKDMPAQKGKKGAVHACRKNGIVDKEWPLVENPKPKILPLITGRPVEKLCRWDHSFPGSRIFTLRDFLTPAECTYYINQAKQIGYSSLAQEFQEEYRNNKRLSVNCPELAAHLWKVLNPQFIEADLEGVTPFGYGNRGEWRPVGLGSWFKFSEYEPNTYFKAHMDSSYVINDDLQSVYTIMIYLNDDFQGGKTSFYPRDDVDGKGPVEFVLSAAAGQAVLFNHDTRHAGLVVKKGTKYIMRTEVLFERLSEPFLSPEPSLVTAKELFDTADFLERKGDFMEACRFHLQAMELQVQRGSFEWKEAREGVAENRIVWPLAKETYTHVCEFLSLSEIGMLCCASKRHYLLTRDGGLWRKLYQLAWPGAYVIESSNAVAMQGWYPRYKSAWLTTHKFCPMLFDFGACFTKFAMLGHHAREKPIPLSNPSMLSVVGTEYQVHYSVSGNGEDQLIRIGDAVRATSCINIHFPWMVNVPLISGRFLRALYARHRIKPANHPVLLALPMHLTLESIEGIQWMRTMRSIFADGGLQAPSVGFVDSAVAVIVEAGLKDGVCVSVGYSRVVVAGVRNCKRVFTVSAPSGWLLLMGGLAQANLHQFASLAMDAVPFSLEKASIFFEKSPELGPLGLPGFVYDTLLKGAGSQHKDLLSGMVLSGSITSQEEFHFRFSTAFRSLLSPQEKEIFNLVSPRPDGQQVVIRGAAMLAQNADTRSLFKSPEPRDPILGATPLLSACFAGDIEEVERLLKDGANPENTEKRFGQTAIMIAASRGHAQVCRLLLDHGANKLAKDKDGWTAFDIAESKAQFEVINVLEPPVKLQKVSLADLM